MGVFILLPKSTNFIPSLPVWRLAHFRVCGRWSNAMDTCCWDKEALFHCFSILTKYGMLSHRSKSSPGGFLHSVDCYRSSNKYEYDYRLCRTVLLKADWPPSSVFGFWFSTLATFPLTKNTVFSDSANELARVIRLDNSLYYCLV